MIVRREVVLGGALTILFGGASTCPCGAVSSGGHAFGCYVAPEEAGDFFARSGPAELALPNMSSVRYGSGSDMFDYVMARTLAHISELASVTPAFAFFNEAGPKNAFATDIAMLRHGTGTILFGKKMITHLLQAFAADRGPAITSICAHEFGHFVAYERKFAAKLMPDRTKPYRSEQFADFFAGWYAGERKRLSDSFPASVFATVLGSLSLAERSTHGTSMDRTLAIVEGYKASFERQLSVNDALQAALQYALSQPET